MVFMVEMLGRGVRDAVCEFILICRSPLDDLGREEKIGPRIEPDAGPVAENCSRPRNVLSHIVNWWRNPGTNHGSKTSSG